MTREEAINSFKKSNEQAILTIQLHSHIMDTSEIRELEWYIERDEMAIKALQQEEPKTGHWIVDDFTGLIKCDICGNDAYMDTTSGEQCKSNYCPNCGCRMSEVSE